MDDKGFVTPRLILGLPPTAARAADSREPAGIIRYYKEF
jgi:hypothetical protein